MLISISIFEFNICPATTSQPTTASNPNSDIIIAVPIVVVVVAIALTSKYNLQKISEHVTNCFC